MVIRRNGFMNLLFDGNREIFRKNKREGQDESLKKIQQLVESQVFVPRTRMKNTRILKFSDSISVNKDSKQIAKHITKIFVDGCHLAELIPRRQLVTQNYQRTIEKDRMYSPELKTRKERYSFSRERNRENLSSLEMRQESQNQKVEKKQKEKEKQNPEVDQFQTVQIITKEKDIEKDFISLDCSTNSSSNKVLKRAAPSVRYRRINNYERKNFNFSKESYDVRQQNKRKAALELKKQLVKFYSNHFGSPENISSKAYIIIEHLKNTNQNLTKCLQVALNSKINLQIASLTKIMTCILTLEICQKYKIDIKNQQIIIGHFETKIEGTSADLQPGQIYTVQQLLYGLMLPSGNDASIALSVFCGELIQNAKKDYRKNGQQSYEGRNKKTYYKNFILEMNRKSLTLDMKRTFFTNSHGLPNQLNKSCASDVAILIDYSLKNQLFRKIIGTTDYECEISFRESSRQNQIKFETKKKMMRWENTHRFVHSKPDLYKGIKTGITQTAGPCLASLIQFNNRQFIIVVLNSKTQKWRYKDTQALRQWLFKKQQFIYVENE